MQKVLLFEDNRLYNVAMRQVLKRCGFYVENYDHPVHIIHSMNMGASYDLLLTDLSSTDSCVDGYGISEISKRLHPDIPVFTMSDYNAPLNSFVDVHLSKNEPIPKLVNIIKNYLNA